MLNSEELADLKIEALSQSSANQHKYFYFTDLGQALATSTNDHIIIEGSANGNILSFSLVLLSHIF